MSGESVVAAISSVPLPCAHMAFPIGSAPALPWCVYYLDEMDGYAADNTLLAKRNRWVIEHYWKVHDDAIEASLEQAILDNFGAYTKTETWVDTENCVQTTYYFSEIE